VLAEFKDTKLEIQGHTDDAKITKGGKFPDNTALSQARAESVKAYFVGKGIDESRLTPKGYGESQPVEDPAGLKGAKLKNARARNRRVEFKLITADVAPPPPAEEPTKPEPAPEEKKPE
jgi:outer membrane protein OmpA-like peptidoglycan-associated protein